MGIFDLPAPVFYFLDEKLSFLSDFIRLFSWGVFAGVLGIVFYALISPQNTISRVKGALREAQGQLAASDESFGELWQLIKTTLTLSLKHLGLAGVVTTHNLHTGVGFQPIFVPLPRARRTH